MCIRKKSFLPILVLSSILKMAVFSGVLLFAVFSLTISAPVDKRLQALNDTLSAIERVVRYYKSTFRELNIDGLFGLRVLEGKSAAGCSLPRPLPVPGWVVFYSYSLTTAYMRLRCGERFAIYTIILSFCLSQLFATTW